MDLTEAIRARRSVRRFLPKAIPDDVLTDILDAGRLAPSSGGGQSFFFGVVRDDAQKRELATAAGNQQWIATAPVVIAHCARLGPDLATVGSDHQGRIVNIERFGADLVGYLDAYPDRTAVRVFFENATPLIPGQQVYLAAVGHGLSACWIGHLNTREASRILRLPEDMVCLFLMPVGYADEEPSPKQTRDIRECVFHDRWGSGIEG